MSMDIEVPAGWEHLFPVSGPEAGLYTVQGPQELRLFAQRSWTPTGALWLTPEDGFALSRAVTSRLPAMRSCATVVCDPLALFEAESLTEAESRRAFRELLKGVARFPGVLVALAIEREGTRPELLREMVGASKGLARWAGPPSPKLVPVYKRRLVGDDILKAEGRDPRPSEAWAS